VPGDPPGDILSTGIGVILAGVPSVQAASYHAPQPAYAVLYGHNRPERQQQLDQVEDVDGARYGHGPRTWARACCRLRQSNANFSALSV